ncbi:MAG: MATE family efflux transporter [Planctomycetota bacterium]
MKSPIVEMPGVLRPALYLAGPVLVEQLLNALVGLVDTWLTGHYVPGAAAMAAIGLMAYLMWMLQSVFASVAIGSTALVARFVGGGDRRLARRTTNQAFFCGAIMAIIAMVLLKFGGLRLIELLNLRGESAELANRYAQILVWVIPPLMVLHVGNACLRGAGDTISGFVAMTCLNVVNVVVGATLVTGAFGTGLLGISPLGWDGLAIGTAAGHYVGAAIVLLLLWKGRRGLHLRPRWLKPDRELIGRLLKIGLPGGADMAVVLACHLWFVRIVNSLGELESSAHMLAVRMESLAYLPGTAFQVAAATMAGQYLGAGRPGRAFRGVMAAMGLGLMAGFGTGAWFYFGPESLTAFFTGRGTAATAEAAIPVLQMAAFAMPSLLISMVLSGALRGAGDTRWPLLITLVGMVGIRIPLAYALVAGVPWLVDLGLPTGLQGAWLAMVIDVIFRSGCAMARFLHGGWQRAQV